MVSMEVTVDKLTNQVTKVLKKFNEEWFTLSSTDSCPTHLFYKTIEGYDITIGDDDERQEYEVMLENIKDKDGNVVSDDRLLQVLSGLFGEPRVIKDNKGKVWFHTFQPTKKVKVHCHNGTLEFYRSYNKV